MSLKDKSSLLCIVTGGSKGFGRAISLEVCKEWGVNRRIQKIVLVLVARDKMTLENTAAECKSIYNDVTLYLLSHDLSDHDSILTLIEELNALFCHGKEQFTEVMLFANAGRVGDVSKPISSHFDPKILQKYFNLMLTSNILISSWFTSELKSVKKTIIFVSSLLAIQPYAGFSLYSAGKAGGHMLFRCMAEENPEVRVLVYSPGPLQTDMTDDVLKNMCFKKTQERFTQMKFLKPEFSVSILFGILKDDKYKSGEYIDIYDIIKQE
ncbi:hypothetical protein LOD99_4695 [Oopsacas minuta]|uniref:Sepiapterin reductase n=1 Tax=Oopsacas minuta TaxID=111878 RepID=A0AAV7JUJ2_9METZ|nr:hypothetical protein LOD99_4695 [Oopsacas minuta]